MKKNTTLQTKQHNKKQDTVKYKYHLQVNISTSYKNTSTTHKSTKNPVTVSSKFYELQKKLQHSKMT